MNAETSSARGEWVLVPREPSAGMLDSAENAMIESEWAYNAGEPDARSDAHGFPTMRIWQAVVAYRAMLAAAPPPPSAPVGVEGLVRLLERIRDLLASLPADCLGSGTDASGQPYPIRDEVIHGITNALAQQPAAVDEFAADRERLLRAFMMECGIIGAKEAGVNLARGIKAALTTQHQEPTT